MRIAIGLVDNRQVLHKPFTLSLIGVIRFFDAWSKGRGLDAELDVVSAENGGVDDMRNAVAEEAVRGGYDYVFWMDSDQTFPPDCLPRMLGYCENDGYEAVTGLYTYKTPPYMPHAYPKLVREHGKFAIPTEFPLDRPFVVEGAGFGCLLMRTSVFARVAKPWFTMRYEDGRLVEGEDLPFCARAGMRMVLDPNVRCGHLRTAQFGIADYLTYNGIKVGDDGWVRPTRGQRDRIAEEMGRDLP